MSKPPKKKFKDTKVGKFLLGKSGLVNTIGDVLPDKGVFGIVKNLIDKDPELPPQDKETALKLLEMDIIEMENVKVGDHEFETDKAEEIFTTKPSIQIYGGDYTMPPTAKEVRAKNLKKRYEAGLISEEKYKSMTKRNK